MFRFENRVLFLRWLLLLALGLGCGYFAWTESPQAALGLAALSLFKVYGWLWPYLRARLSLLREGRVYEDPEYRVEVPSGWTVEREVSSDPSCVTLTLDGPDYLLTLKVLPGLADTSSLTQERCEELVSDDFKVRRSDPVQQTVGGIQVEGFHLVGSSSSEACHFTFAKGHGSAGMLIVTTYRSVSVPAALLQRALRGVRLQPGALDGSEG